MRLFEYEGKELLRKYGIATPKGRTIKSADELNEDKEFVLKAQILAGKRGKAGGVKLCQSLIDAKAVAMMLIGSTINDEKVEMLLAEEKISKVAEYYAGILYDTGTKSPVLVLSKMGGVDVEEIAEKHPEHIVKKHIDPILGLHDWAAREVVKQAGFESSKINKLASVLVNLWKCFYSEDARLVEINPLAETADGAFVALDSRIDLDDDAGYRHKDRNYQPRSPGLGRPLTQRELEVKKANAEDYKGTVKYIELGGDIGFLAAGGGGSITCMDALYSHGGKPSNYTEYSGNPSTEKLYKLTKQILSKPGLTGLWIVGAIANFTRVDTTMQGIVDALAEVKPKFPIVVRRSGPFEKEGLQILKEAAEKYGLDMEVHGAETPMTKTAKIIVEKADEFKKKYGGS